MFKYVGVIVGATVFFAAVSLGGDFRENDWGDSPEAVLMKEGEGCIGHFRPSGWGDRDYTGSIGYGRGKHGGVDAVIGFFFTPQEKLGMGFCVAYKPGIKPFCRWEGVLSAFYGEPENRDDVLIDDEALLTRYYRGDAAAVEEGLLKGYFALIRYWESEKTLIWLVAELKDDKLRVHIQYYSKEYFDFFRDEKRKAGPRKGYRPWFDNGNE